MLDGVGLREEDAMSLPASLEPRDSFRFPVSYCATPRHGTTAAAEQRVISADSLVGLLIPRMGGGRTHSVTGPACAESGSDMGGWVLIEERFADSLSSATMSVGRLLLELTAFRPIALHALGNLRAFLGAHPFSSAARKPGKSSVFLIARF